jgi:hypothetical protein
MAGLRRISLAKPEGEAGKAWPAIVMGFFVAFGGVLFGYDTGTISGILAMVCAMCPMLPSVFPLLCPVLDKQWC